VIRRFLKLKAWRETERIAVGGGFRASRVGELVIGRADVILKAKGVDVELAAIRNDPEAAGSELSLLTLHPIATKKISPSCGAPCAKNEENRRTCSGPPQLAPDKRAPRCGRPL
jgi:hypothetical protein